jgi:NAD(P)H-hydrate epimerase
MNNETALLDVRRMGEADRLTIAAGTPSTALMENAGKAVAIEIQRRWSVRPITVLCGPGNNGGDGFVAASRLTAAGWNVRLGLLGSRDHLSGAARHHAALWRGEVEPLSPEVLDGAELVVDAVFGSGLSRALSGAAASTLAAAARMGLPIVAIDVPSGLMGDTGEALGAVGAVLTVTFFRKKPCHVLLPGRMLCGDVAVVDIGTAAGVIEKIAPDAWENSPALWSHDLPSPHDGGSKYSRGHALVSGGYPMTGAARMAARAAARMGAGLTTIAVPQIALPIYAASVTSIMVEPLAAQDDFDRLLDDKRISGFLIGPALASARRPFLA